MCLHRNSHEFRYEKGQVVRRFAPMFGLFHPVCPCDPAAKRWIELRLLWLSREFGLHMLLERPIILPTDQFFPDPYDGSPKTVERLFRRVCRYMEVDPRDVDIELFTDDTPGMIVNFDPSAGFAAGTWQGGDGTWMKGVVRIERSALDRPANLIGTMAHELA